MLHLSWLPYPLAAAAIALTLLAHGPRALAYDGHPLQWFEAAMMLWAGAEAFRLTRLQPSWRLLFSLGAAWLAVDELLMFHECAKWKWLPGTRGDPLVIAYAVLGLAAGVAVLRAHPERRRALPHLVAAGIGALVAVLADLHVFGLQTAGALITEEGGEFLAIAGGIAVFRCAPAVRPLRPVAWVLASAAWLFVSLWVLRPWLCPARLL